ncbi:MAG: transcription termination factor Rho [Tepidisphaeraceae bacterium]|jgi:transcription termination factor Rho
MQSATTETLEGILHIPDPRQDGQLRDPAHPLRPLRQGIVPRRLISEFQLRPGLMIKGFPKGGAISQIQTIEGLPTQDYLNTVHLYDGTALDPEPFLRLEHNPTEFTTRVIDILAPVGFGQRGLIVAPPRSGKTILLQNIARGIHANYPDVKLVLLLVDERPEEVTDMKRNVPGIVYASSNDNTVEKHLDLAQLIIERCKREVEFGKNIVVLLDSLTRLGRAFNTGGPSGGRTLSGGLDNRALEIPKRLFGAARKIENGGSLTILATCLIDTGSRMDQVIFEEFKGTGNMELCLDRNLANQRIYPALDIAASGTRKEEKLLTPQDLEAARRIRRLLSNMPPAQAMKTLLDVMAKQKTNAELFAAAAKT